VRAINHSFWFINDCRLRFSSSTFAINSRCACRPTRRAYTSTHTDQAFNGQVCHLNGSCTPSASESGQEPNTTNAFSSARIGFLSHHTSVRPAAPARDSPKPNITKHNTCLYAHWPHCTACFHQTRSPPRGNSIFATKSANVRDDSTQLVTFIFRPRFCLLDAQPCGWVSPAAIGRHHGTMFENSICTKTRRSPSDFSCFSQPGTPNTCCGSLRPTPGKLSAMNLQLEPWLA
jgi:hypothetical protein